MTIYIVNLKYEIIFDDSDGGACWAGDGERLIKLFIDKTKAEDFINEWNPIISRAEDETTIIPRQPYNSKLKEGLGFDLNDLDQNQRDYKLSIDECEVEE